MYVIYHSITQWKQLSKPVIEGYCSILEDSNCCYFNFFQRKQKSTN